MNSLHIAAPYASKKHGPDSGLLFGIVNFILIRTLSKQECRKYPGQRVFMASFSASSVSRVSGLGQAREVQTVADINVEEVASNREEINLRTGPVNIESINNGPETSYLRCYIYNLASYDVRWADGGPGSRFIERS